MTQTKRLFPRDISQSVIAGIDAAMPGALLDTRALYWLVSGAYPLTDEALVAIGEAGRRERSSSPPITRVTGTRYALQQFSPSNDRFRAGASRDHTMRAVFPEIRVPGIPRPTKGNGSLDGSPPPHNSRCARETLFGARSGTKNKRQLSTM
jgi:hypothetical protein